MNKRTAKRTAVSLLQNAAIFLLSISAAFLLLQVFSFETGTSITLSGLFPSDLSPSQKTTYSTTLSDMAAPANMVVTGNYGRSSVLLGDGITERNEGIRSLMQEAFGSAESMKVIEETAFRKALSYPGIYVDYLSPFPAEVVAGRLGASFTQPHSVRHVLMVDEGFDTLVLYLWDGADAVCRYQTASAASVLDSIILSYTADDTFFAFEGGNTYAHLDPYTLLRRSTVSTQKITAAVPALSSDSDQLLSLLDFNVHTESRYRLSNGTEVIVESPRSLRIRVDGTIEYTGDENTASSHFHVYSTGESPTAADAVLAARNLTEPLFSGTEFSSTQLYLSHIETTANGYELSFDYMVNALPVSFSDDAPAMTVTVTGSTITAFTLRWRQYTLSEELHTLLPARQAAAIAADYDTPFMTIGYVDNGSSTLLPDWLAR